MTYRKIAVAVFGSLLSTTAITSNAQSKTAYNAKQGVVTITGKIGNINSPMQLWIYMGDEKWDTVKIKNGVFTYTKKTLLPAYGAVTVRYKPFKENDPQSGSFFSNKSMLTLYFDEGLMQIATETDTLSNLTNVTGSGSTLLAQSRELNRKMQAIEAERKLLASELNNAPPEQLQNASYMEEFERKNALIDERRDSLLLAEVKKNPTSFPLHDAFYGFLYYSGKSADPKKVRAIYNSFPRDLRDSETGRIWESMMPTAMEQGQAKVAGNGDELVEVKPNNRFLEVGSIMPEFELKDPSGRAVKMSDYRGKYVLVDFWASWCGPCRAENPNLKALHKKYSSSGFDVLSVSIDDNKEKWQTAIIQDGLLSWKHGSDLKGAHDGLAKRFDIKGVPDSFLIDPQGRIIMRRGSMEAIDRRLAQVLK